jgi:23S rRNA (cytidine1920-2'-O)/16S rRNA (cytidine1409-2'-O)-methyltransferase
MRERLDKLLVERGYTQSRESARRLVMAGTVRVADRVVDKPGAMVAADAPIDVRATEPRFASRGGLKLEAALEHFRIALAGCIVLDVGASTGGFTDCVLQRGARTVYAVDVGYGQLDWKLRNDERVVVLERTNARFLTAEMLPGPASVAVIDVSFISLRLVLPALIPFLAPTGHVIALVKPQFEAGRAEVGAHGIVSDPAVHEAVIARVTEAAAACGLARVAMVASAITGATGNQEFFLHLTTDRWPDTAIDD